MRGINTAEKKILVKLICMIVTFSATLHSQPQTRTPVAERIRQRDLSANEKALGLFFQRNLPPGWTFESQEKSLTLRKVAPVYLLALPLDEFRNLSKPALLTLAKKQGKKIACTIGFRIERHDDIAIVRQRVRLFKEIRADIKKAYDRLNLKHLCRGWTAIECSLTHGAGRDAALEYLTTREILSKKLEITPLYRIGTLYLYPLKDQCVPPPSDWYVTNTQIKESDRVLPFEAIEELEIILRNLEQVRLWD